MTDERPVLLMTGNSTTLPLWQPLSEIYDLCIAHPQMAGMLGDLSLSGFGLQKYMSAELQETSVNAAYRMTSELFLDEFATDLSKTIGEAFPNGVPENLTSPQVLHWWPSMVGEHLRNEIMIVEMLEKLKNERHISGCVVHEDVTPDARTIVLWCKANQVPTVHVPHANCFYAGEGWDIHTESLCDYISAAGSYMADWYSKWGFDSGRIKVTGVPQLDSWYSNNVPSKHEARQVLNVDDDAFLLVYATTWAQLTSSRGGFDAELNESLRQAYEAAKELNAVLCVKMHPGETPNQEQIYLNAMKSYGITGFVSRQYNEYVLRAADVMLTHGPSNICVSAAMIGMPCSYIETEDFEFPFPSPVKVSRGGNATHALKIAMQLEREGTWEIFAHSMNDAHPNGGATERTTEFVREVCQ